MILPPIDEHNIQVAILQHLYYYGAKDVFAVAIPNAGKRSFRTAGRMKAEGLTPGAADLCVLLPHARVIWLETKTRKGVQSDAQKGFQAKTARLGHIYRVVRTIEEAIKILKMFGALR